MSTLWALIRATHPGPTLAVAALILIVSRTLRVLFGKVAGWLGRHLPRRLAWVLGVALCGCASVPKKRVSSSATRPPIAMAKP